MHSDNRWFDLSSPRPTCLQASFVSSGNRTDISLDDPNFWAKWAKIAELEIDSKSEKVGENTFLTSLPSLLSLLRLHLFYLILIDPIF